MKGVNMYIAKDEGQTSKHYKDSKKDRQNRMTNTIKKALKINESFWKPFNKALKQEK
jgi:hypothetical protein